MSFKSEKIATITFKNHFFHVDTTSCKEVSGKWWHRKPDSISLWTKYSITISRKCLLVFSRWVWSTCNFRNRMDCWSFNFSRNFPHAIDWLNIVFTLDIKNSPVISIVLFIISELFILLITFLITLVVSTFTEMCWTLIVVVF